MKETKQIVTPNFSVFMAELEEHLSLDWKIDWEQMPPAASVFLYECGLVREVEENAQPKLTRAEILAKAREAKAAKKAAEQEG